MKHIRVLAAAATLLFVATAAQAQRGRGDDRRDHQDRRGQVSPPVQHRHDGDDRGRAVESQQRAAAQARAEQQRAAEMQIQRRSAQDEERREQAARREELNRVYDRDDRAGYNYRYNMAGIYRQTNHFGVDALRRAVDLGYQQGYRSGQMDRRDGAPADLRRALEFQDGAFGYSGTYVPQGDYSYYFGEGFQRGYDDAYWSRSQYGTYYNGNASILAGVVAGILGLTMLH
jgi:hypothetical protein